MIRDTLLCLFFSSEPALEGKLMPYTRNTTVMVLATELSRLA